VPASLKGELQPTIYRFKLGGLPFWMPKQSAKDCTRITVLMPPLTKYRRLREPTISTPDGSSIPIFQRL
jgi:hypothetical protein